MSLCSQRPKTAEKRTSNHSIDHCSEFLHDRWGHVQRQNCCQSTIWSLARTLARKTRQDYLWVSACSPPCIPSLGGGCKTQTLNRLCLHSTMRHYVLASCRTRRKPGSESFLRIHSTCKKWHLKQSKRLNDNHLQAFTWQLSQVTCWDFLGWTRWQVQGKEINQNNTSSHQTFAPMTPNDNGPNRRHQDENWNGWNRLWPRFRGKALKISLNSSSMSSKATEAGIQLKIANWKVGNFSLLGYCYFCWNLVSVCDVTECEMWDRPYGHDG